MRDFEMLTRKFNLIMDYNKENLSDITVKQKPKFKVGDWFVAKEDNNYARFIQILEFVNVYGKKRCRISRDIHNDEDVVEFEFIENAYNPWNISYAEDGDILTGILERSEIGCLPKDAPYNIELIFMYCKVDADINNIHSNFSLYPNDLFVPYKLMFYKDFIHNICPATTKQRNLLFQKMKENGYKLDSEKKELKRIEQKIWSEEDERICQCLIQDQEEALDDVCNDKYGHSEIISDLKEMYRERINWLESIKERVTWRPSKEQIIALRWVINNIPYNKHKEEISGLIDQIKEL